MKSVLKRMTAIVIAALMMAMTLAGCGSNSGNSLSNNLDDVSDKFEDAADDAEKDAADIDVDKLKKSADKIKDLDLTTDVSTGNDDEDDDSSSNDDTDTPEGDLTVYSFTDVYKNGNDITVVPNGGLNANTELFTSGKDLDGFLDYVDSEVLEPGRTINREFFYDLLSINLIDKDLSSSTSYIETNMMVCLAVANNFHDTDVKVRSCNLDNNNGADYHYNVTAYGKDDTWLVNYQDRTFYMNDGATEYHSTMFKDEYLSVWLVAIEEYYGISSTN